MMQGESTELREDNLSVTRKNIRKFHAINGDKAIGLYIFTG